MAAWVKANIRYSLVVEKIEPLEAELEEQVMQLEKSQRRLQTCEDELKEIDDRVGTLKDEFASRTAEAERLKRNLSIAGETLDKAEGLIGQLGGEQERWRSTALTLRSDLASLPVKMLLAAGFTTYLAKEPEDRRADMLVKWAALIASNEIGGSGPAFSFKRTLTTESELLQWKSMGLPADDLSQENGLVIQTEVCERPCLFVSHLDIAFPTPSPSHHPHSSPPDGARAVHNRPRVRRHRLAARHAEQG